MKTERQILETVAATTGISIAQMQSKSRERCHVDARYLAMYFIRFNRPDVSFKKIAKIFKRHHSSVINAIQCVEDWCAVDTAFQYKYLQSAEPLGFHLPPKNTSILKTKTIKNNEKNNQS